MSTSSACNGVMEIDLSGEWSFELDRLDQGVAERWWARSLKGALRLPGSLQAQGHGDDVSFETPWIGHIRNPEWHKDPNYAPYQAGGVKFPFWLQPDKHYVGVAWYQRRVRIPAGWEGKRIVAVFERAHWGTTLWWDGAEVGSNDSLSVPHVYDVTRHASPGEHTITVRVDNRLLLPVGHNAHSVSDHTQTNWNGIAGALKLVATDRVWIDDVQVYPDVPGRAARVRVRIGNMTGKPAAASLRLSAAAFNAPAAHTPRELEAEVAVGPEGAEVELAYELGPGALLWDEFQPALYRLRVALAARAGGDKRAGGVECAGEREVVFGLRTFAAEGTQFAINGRKTFLRGTLECAVFPHTGYPPTDVAEWRKILRAVKDHGLNHVRFHSWCPPEAAFVAADELGVYFQIECAVWTYIGEGKPIDEWLYREAERIIQAYGNHPSFVMLAHGNEPYGKPASYLAAWVSHWKAKDPRRLYTSGAGWPIIPESDFHSTPEPRIQRWGEGLKSRINAAPPATTADYSDWVAKHEAPVVSHEIGQWCAFPNFAEIEKYTGFLKAKNFELFRESLAAHGMGDQANDFLMASGKLQTLCYKEDIEAALRTPGFGGFQLLGLNDFPGQGTALVGSLDAFWESKGYVTPHEYRRFCNSTVLLARLKRRIFTETQPFCARIEVAHFGPEPLVDTAVVWRLLDEGGKAVRRGAIPVASVPIGNGIVLGEVSFPWTGLRAARRYRFEVYFEGYPFVNDWDVWLFPGEDGAANGIEAGETSGSIGKAGGPAVGGAAPGKAAGEGGVLVTRDLASARERLLAGDKVLWLIDPAWIDNGIAVGFSPVFWNTVWTNGQAPHTLGILCDPEHPALRKFPTEFHTNWQWWELLHGAAAMNLDSFGLRPIVQVIDTWFRNLKLGLLFEAKVGPGRLLACSMDLESGLESRPVARYLRRCLLEYVASAEFDPEAEVEPAALERLREGSALGL